MSKVRSIDWFRCVLCAVLIMVGANLAIWPMVFTQHQNEPVASAPATAEHIFPKVTTEEGRGACASAIATLRPNFAPQGWVIRCAPKVELSAIAEKFHMAPLEYYGFTLGRGDRSYTLEAPGEILISEATPNTLLAATITHEWAHAYKFTHFSPENDAQWKDLVSQRLSDTTVGVEEIWAESLARCTAGHNIGPKTEGINVVSCDIVSQMLSLVKATKATVS